LKPSASRWRARRCKSSPDNANLSNYDDCVTVNLSKDEYEELHFTVIHIGEMIRELHVDYYAAWEDERLGDRRRRVNTFAA
jgi:hypothetical protein